MKPSKQKNLWIPQPRIIAMMIMLAAMMGGLFSIMLGSIIPGMIGGFGFAAAFYLIVVIGGRRSVRNLKNHKNSGHRGRI